MNSLPARQPDILTYYLGQVLIQIEIDSLAATGRDVS